jgi:hypothetical protein
MVAAIEFSEDTNITSASIRAEAICQRWLADDAMESLACVSDAVRREALTTLLRSPREPPVALFSDATESVRRFLMQRVWPSFQRSSAYSELLAAANRM